MLTGAILAGGKSLRYGCNKALETFAGKSLIEHAVVSLSGFCDPVLVVANDLVPYLHLRAILVQDVVMEQGPLGGIYTALLFSPHDWVFTKATDMPFLTKELVKMMGALRGGCDAVVPLLNDRVEPLLALYSRRCLPSIAAAIEKEEKKVTSFYRKVRMRELPEQEWRKVDPEGLSFKNVNTPDILEELLGVVSRDQLSNEQ
jgi:molybdopterin-guanine dinucleotide biosynthesis protein A